MSVYWRVSEISKLHLDLPKHQVVEKSLKVPLKKQCTFHISSKIFKHTEHGMPSHGFCRFDKWLFEQSCLQKDLDVEAFPIGLEGKAHMFPATAKCLGERFICCLREIRSMPVGFFMYRVTFHVQ